MRQVVEFGGTGRGILLLHGLMGRATTWWPVAQWLTRYGRVVGIDARAHGRNPVQTGRTADFVQDAAEVVRGLGPSVVIGHSMGGLHAWALAAEHPDLVTGIVVEDMAPDQRGRTADNWRAYFESWPVPFQSLAHVRQFFGSQGDYFVECFEERADGYHLIADLERLYPIAAEWGEADFWPLVEKVQCPMLAIEAAHSAMPAGQMSQLPLRAPGGGQHIVVPDAGHVVHRDQPAHYRGAVEAFLAGLA
ncbi:MAG: alpha/beta hydrolase [Kibdelosporangium sp.]